MNVPRAASSRSSHSRAAVPELLDAVLADAGIEVVLTDVRIPQLNAVMERRIRTCRHELLDRTLIWNQHHLPGALREFEAFYNSHRPTEASPTPGHCVRHAADH
jgi:transposase InsO family protein